MRRYKQRFTLIELLAVIAIAGVLLGLLAPAFASMLFGGKVDECAQNIRQGLEFAQSHAVASRKYVAMIFLQETSADDLKQYCHGGYRLAYVTKDGDNWKFDKWLNNEPWRNAADGAMLVAVVKESEKNKGAADFVTNGEAPKKFENPEVTIGSLPSGLTKYQAIIFSKLGGVAAGYQALYFVVTEGKVEGSTCEYANLDNYLKIKLNPITGKVSFYDDAAGGE